MTRKTLLALSFSAIAIIGATAHAEEYVITLKDHRFTPQNLTLPAGQKIKLTVKNEQAAPAEFESADLSREKVVGANSEITVNLGPLDAGSYSYVDDFHRETAGTITVK